MERFKNFIRILGLACSLHTAAVWGAEKITPAADDQLRYLPPGKITVSGHWGEQINSCLEHRVLAQQIADLVQPFRDRKDKTEWRSEFWGKWITSAELAQRWNADPRLNEVLSKAVQELIATQTPDGYIGAYNTENRLWNWDIWGRKYSLLGLLGWNDLTEDAPALAAARRLADHLLTEVGPACPTVDMFKHDMWSGMACSSVIEPMTQLYRRTGEKKYLDFVLWVLNQWERPGGPDLVRKALRGDSVFKMFPGPKAVMKDYGDGGHSKAYEMMSCYEGLIELYRITGKEDYKMAALKVFENIRDTEITIIGSGSDWERWCDGTRRQTEPWVKGMETCVTVTWIKFAAQLQRLTGEARYGDLIECAAQNALLGALSTDGAWFCHHAPLAGEKERAPEQCNMKQNCCVASGPRGLMLLPLLAIMQSQEGPAINLYGAMNASLRLPSGNQVKITQQTDYPVGDTIKISVQIDRSETFPIKLRIPAWSQTTSVAINTIAQKSPLPGGWMELRRTWKSGDAITVRFDMTARRVRAPGDSRYAAIVRGPMVLARDARLGGDVNAVAPLRIKDDNRIALQKVSSPQGSAIWTAWKAPLADGGSITLCDFASAGNTWNKTSEYRVWLPEIR